MPRKKNSRSPFPPPPERLSTPIRDHAKFAVAKRMEQESILLLRNERHVLPLTMDKPVAVLGNGQVVSNTGGGGSGGSLGSFRVGFLTAMDEQQRRYVPELAALYREKAAAGGGSFAEVHGWDDEDAALWGEPQCSNSGWNRYAPIAVPELKLPEAMLDRAAAATDTALVLLSRTVGTEEMDRGVPQPSDWYLNPSEQALLRQAVSHFAHVVVILNCSAVIDFSWLTELDPQGRIEGFVLQYGAGSYYGEALVELLYGDANFSAKLADTVCRRIEDYPTTKNYGGSQSYAANGAKPGLGDNGRRYATRNGAADPVSVYQEYVYPGYRYFDTFAGSSDAVLWPFGFGLSYSDFALSGCRLEKSGDRLTLSAEVENLGPRSGKEVLQVYVSCPQGKLDQPFQKLVGFAKTDELRVHEKQTLSVSFSLYDLSSYDESDACYVLEPGEFLFRAGNSSRSTVVAGALRVESRILTSRLHNRLGLDSANPDGGDANRREFARLRLNALHGCDPLPAAPAEGYPVLTAVQTDVTPLLAHPVPAAQDAAPTDRTATLQAVADGSVSLDAFAAQMTDDELLFFEGGGCGAGNAGYAPDDPGLPLTTGKSKPSAPNAYVAGAGCSRRNTRLGIPTLSYADGSAGVPIAPGVAELLHTDPNAAYPRAAGIACIWDPALFRLWGRTVGGECRAANIDVWLAPSINLHRNPLCGRNTEYYSEDPVLSGIAAREIAAGAAEAGVTVCVKHFVANEQEQFRRGLHTNHSEAAGTSLDAINSISAERALREISLKPFEIAIRGGNVHSLMSSFNKVNGWYAASCPDLLTHILREEWGFDGFVVTDWGDYDEIADAADELAAGVDMIMSGTHTRYSIPDEIRAGFEAGRVTRAQLLRNAKNTLHTMLLGQNLFCNGRYNTGNVADSDIPYHETTELRILTTQLPPAIAGTPYETLKVTPLYCGGDEGTPFYRWSISPDSPVSAEALAEIGLTLHGSGVLSGVPAAGHTGLLRIRFRVESDRGFAEKELPLEVRDLALLPLEMPEARLMVPYHVQMTAYGPGTPTLRLEGELPEGITFCPETGVLSGMPSEESLGRQHLFTITAEGGGASLTQHYALTPAPRIDVAIRPENRAVVEVGQNVRIPIVASRGLNSCHVDVSAVGDVPEGITAGGIVWFGYHIEGVPTKPGVYHFQVRVSIQDSLPEIVQLVPYTLEVVSDEGEPLRLETASLPDGAVNKLYSAQLLAVGGSGRKTYSLGAGAALPTGTQLSPDGLLTCAPMASDSALYHLPIRITDEAGSAIEAELPLLIGGILKTDPAHDSVLRGKAGAAQRFCVRASGGFTNEYSYSLLHHSDGLAVELRTNEDFSAELTVRADADGEIVLLIDESFSGSPVTTAVRFRVEVEA